MVIMVIIFSLFLRGCYWFWVFPTLFFSFTYHVAVPSIVPEFRCGLLLSLSLVNGVAVDGLPDYKATAIDREIIRKCVQPVLARPRFVVLVEAPVSLVVRLYTTTAVFKYKKLSFNGEPYTNNLITYMAHYY